MNSTALECSEAVVSGDGVCLEIRWQPATMTFSVVFPKNFWIDPRGELLVKAGGTVRDQYVAHVLKRLQEVALTGDMK